MGPGSQDIGSRMGDTEQVRSALPIRSRGLLHAPLAADALLAVTVASAVGGALLYATRPSTDLSMPASWLGQALTGLFVAAPGALLVRRVPSNPVGWVLLVAGSVSALAGFGGEYALVSGLAHGAHWPATALALWVSGRFGSVSDLGFPLLLLLFPDGRLPSPRWRWVGRLVTLELAVIIVMSVALPGPIVPAGLGSGLPADLTRLQTPIALTGTAARRLSDIVLPFLVVLSATVMIPAFAALVVRFRRSRGHVRNQLSWLVVAGGLATIVEVVGARLPRPLANCAGPVAALAVSVAIGVAVIRHRLYDLDPLLRRGTLYALLAAVLTVASLASGATAGLVLGSTSHLSEGLASALAVAVVALPTRAALQRQVDRFFYGQRADPYSALSQLGARLSDCARPEAVLPQVAEVVASALRLPYAAVELRLGDGSYRLAATTSSNGPPRWATEEIVELPLVGQGVIQGRLLVAPRAPGERFSPSDQRLLDDLAHHAGVAASAVALHADVQSSRERLVTSLEEERRRLQRDLHDGVGPTLAAVVLKTDVALGLIDRDPDRARQILADIKVDVSGAVGGVRQLVDGLRPHTLDQLGLIGALRLRARAFDHTEVAVTVHDDQSLLPLPAATEVAAYLIAGEAMTNAVRHARCANCDVFIHCEDEALTVEVLDDGTGLPQRPAAGVGLYSMRQRAEELGGTCTVASRPGAGTSVVARLPVTAPVQPFLSTAIGTRQ